MNGTFKVIWNKSRQALMAVNEMTSSVQGKGTKTIVAAAVAAAMGGAVATEAGEEAAPPAAEEAPAEDVMALPASPWTDAVINGRLTVDQAASIHSAEIKDGADVTVSASITRDPKEDAVTQEKTSALAVSGGKVKVTETGGIEVNDLTISGGELSAIGTDEAYADQDTTHGRTSPSVGAYKTLVMTGGTVKLEKGGRLWIGSTWAKNPESYGRMALKGGEIQMNGNAWITGNKRFIAAGDYYTGEGYDESLAVHAAEDTLGANTIGFDGAAVKVSGTGNTIDAAKTELTAGSITVAKDAELTIRGTASTNEPAETQDKAAQMIRGNGCFAVTGGTMTIAEKGKVTVEDSLGKVSVTGGAVQNAGTFDFTGTEMTLENAAFENIGMLKGTGSLTIGQGGVLKTAAAKSAAFDAANVTINEGGTLAFTALNSTWDDPATPDDEAKAEGARKDQLLLDGTNYVLAGGTLTGADNIKIGRNNKNAATLTVTKGGYTFKRVRLGNAENAHLTIAGGSLTVTDLLDLRYGKTALQGGTLALEGGYLFGTKDGTFAMTGGKLATTAANLFEVVKSDTAENKAGEAAEAPAAPTYQLSELLTKGDYTGGIIEVTDEGVKLSQKDVTAAVQMLADAGIGSQLVFGDLTFTDDKITFDDALGLNGKNQAVHAPASDEAGNVSLEIDGVTAALGKLVVDKDTKTITVVKSADGEAVGNLMITGMAEGGNVIEGAAVTTLDAAALTLGWDASSKGTVNVGEVKAYQLAVRGDFAADKITLKAFANDAEQVSTIGEGARLAADEINLAEGADAYVNVQGTLEANALNVDVDLANGGELVLGSKLSEADRAAVLIPQAGGSIATEAAGSHDAVVTTNRGGEALLLAAAASAGVAYDKEKNVGLYVDSTIKIGREAGQLLVGDRDDSQDASKIGQAALGSNAVAVVNLKALGGKAAFDADELAVDDNAAIVLSGADRLQTVTLVENGQAAGAAFLNQAKNNIADGNAWLNAYVENDAENNNAKLHVVFDRNASVSAEANALAEQFYQNGHEGTLSVLAALGSTAEGNSFVTDGRINDRGAEALGEYAAMPASAGAYNAAYDAASEVWGSVQRHAVPKAGEPAGGLWADVFYASNEANRIYGRSGYEGDVSGGMFGADWTASCGGKLGAAVAVGKSDADSVGMTGGKYSDSADFWGLSVYASKDFSGLKLAADVTYLSFDNDISGSIAGASLAETIDSSVMSVGLRTDWKAWESGSLSVVPHIGLRYAQIDVDSYRDVQAESMNVIEAPIGLAVNGSLTAGGWHLVPVIDFTIVPQIGDKDVETMNGKVDVLDSLCSTTLGLTAEYGSFEFGANVKYGFGNDDRSNVSANISAVFRF